MKKQKVVCFGEIMLKLSPNGDNLFAQSDNYLAEFGGSEANVAVALSSYGLDVSFVTKLPDNLIAQKAVSVLMSHGVDTSHIVKGGKRIGIYYQEKGIIPYTGTCIYDREDSAIAMAEPEDFDWESILEGADWFHFSGITPALSGNMALICEQACQTAQKMGIPVSCDINYRKKLWPLEKAQEVMQQLLKYVSLVIVNEDEAKVVGYDKPVASFMNYEDYRNFARFMTERFSCSKIASVVRCKTGTLRNVYGIMWSKEDGINLSEKYSIDNAVELSGAGDAFVAALIYGVMQNYFIAINLNVAVAACALKHYVKGDFNLTPFETIRTYVRNKLDAGGVER